MKLPVFSGCILLVIAFNVVPVLHPFRLRMGTRVLHSILFLFLIGVSAVGSSPQSQTTCDFKPFQTRKLHKADIVLLGTSALRNNGYQNIEEIRSGGMGVVLKAEKDGSKRAVKISLRQHEPFISGLEREVEIMNFLAQQDPMEKRFSHAKIVDSEHPDHQMVKGIEMPFIAGYPLSQVLKNTAGTSAQRQAIAEAIQKQIYEQMAFVHAQGVWHLDLKPDNIMVQYEHNRPVVRIIDWGSSARVLENGKTRSVLPDNQGFTLGYVAPERLDLGRQSPADDVYALRRMDWEMREYYLGLPEPESAADGRMVIRNLIPKARPEPTDQLTVLLHKLNPNPSSAVSDGSANGSTIDPVPHPEDPDHYRHSYSEPSGALDEEKYYPSLPSGSAEMERQRLIAAVEWSLVPQTVQDRWDLIQRAKTENIPAFLQSFGRELMRNYRRAAPGSRLQNEEMGKLTLEILNSSFLIDKFDIASDTNPGLGLTKTEVETIARKMVEYFGVTQVYYRHPTALGTSGPHHELRYQRLAARIYALQKQGKIQEILH